MLNWMVVNYKAAIAIIGAIIAAIVAYIISPSLTAIVAFVLSTSQTKATVQEHTARITKIESTVYGIDAKFDLIQNSLKIIEERNYQELKEARQRRQAEKQ